MKHSLLVLATALIISIASQASANGAPSISTQDDDGWHFLFAPYLWGSGLHGDVTSHNITNQVDITFGDVLRNFEGGAEAHFEARNGRWTLMIDGTYIKLSEDLTKQIDVLTVQSNVTNQTTLVDSGVFYRLWGPSPAKSFELLAGGRYFGMTTDIDLSTNINLGLGQNQSYTVSQSIGSLSPIVGARGKYDATPKTHLWARGDVGGFGVDGMNNTWSASGGVTYTVHPNIDLAAAYRVLRTDYSNAADQFSMDTLWYGPVVGVVFYN